MNQVRNIRKDLFATLAYSGTGSALILAFLVSNTMQFDIDKFLLKLPQLALGLFCGWMHLTVAMVAFSLYNGARRPYLRDAAIVSLVCSLLALSGTTSIAFLSSSQQYIMTGISVIIQTYFMGRLAVHLMQLGGEWPTKISIFYGSIMAIFSVSFWFTQAWLDLEIASRYLRLAQGMLFCVLPAVSLLMTCVIDRKAAVHAKIGDFIRARFSGEDAPKDLAVLFLLVSGTISAIFSTVLYTQLSTTTPSLKDFNMRFDVIDYSFVGLLYLVCHAFGSQNSTRIREQITGSLVNGAARKLLLRHMNAKSSWAATMGIRAPSFLVNHDPDGIVASSVPASFVQIRNVEIQKCIQDLLGGKFTAYNLPGNQVGGLIEPELSMHPCIDVLCVFACLQLDAVSRVERRLSGLVNLLPILDPKMAQMAEQQKILKGLTRNVWIFHFNYSWIDQQILRTQTSAQYHISNDEVLARSHVQILDYLKSQNYLGNYIWLGEKARERIAFEAPMLSNIVHAVPFTLANGEEELVFLIKFEELIPRLQMYFGLNRWRTILKDYEPSVEGQRFLGILNLQLPGVQKIADIKAMLTSLLSYDWNGFKEKDRALQLLVALYKKAMAFIQEKPMEPTAIVLELEQLRSLFIEGAAKIGYPSQVLHLAQQDKYAMRSVESIISNAKNPWHPRFHEAWLLLCSLETGRYKVTDLAKLLLFLKEIPKNRSVNANAFVSGKTIEAIANIGQSIPTDGLPSLRETLNRIGSWIMTKNFSLEHTSRFLDCITFLNTLHDGQLTLDAPTAKQMDLYIAHLTATTDDPMLSAEVSALVMRWSHTDGDQGRTLRSAS